MMMSSMHELIASNYDIIVETKPAKYACSNKLLVIKCCVPYGGKGLSLVSPRNRVVRVARVAGPMVQCLPSSVSVGGSLEEGVPGN